MNDRKIKNMEGLLQNIAAGLNLHSKLGNLEVVFYENNKEVLCTNVQTALDYLANDIYWNEDNDWSQATHAKVRSI